MLPTYTTIFLLDPNDIPYEKDDIRQESAEIRMNNHKAFVEVLMEAKREYTLLSGTEEERKQKIDTLLKI